MPEFTSIITEIYINGAWADVSADVRISPPPRVSGIGILDNTFVARTGDIGTYEFSLDNSTGNSAGTLGYYTPYGTNMRTGWDVNLPVRLTFAYDGYSKVKFYGTIDLDGINVETGKYRGRSVSVRASNWMAHAAKHRIDLMQYQTSVRADQAIQCIMDNMDIQPLAFRLDQGYMTFPTMFDITKANTTAMAEFQKIAMSEQGHIYVIGDGTLVFDKYGAGNRGSLPDKYVPAVSSTSTDAILLEDGTNLLLEDGTNILMEQSTLVSFKTGSDQDNMVDLKISYGKEMGNNIKCVTYPRDVDTSAVVLWSLEEPITILAGETLSDIRGAYRDPSNPNIKLSGINMVSPPLSGTDYAMFSNADGLTGTNRTADLVVTARYGTGEVSYDLTNNNAATSYIGLLQARGYGVHIEQESVKTYQQTSSIASYGSMPLTFNFPYLSGTTDLFITSDKTPATAYTIGGFLNGLNYPSARIDQVDFIVNKDSRLMLAFMFCEPPDTMSLYETMTTGTENGVTLYTTDAKTINGYSFEIINGKTVKWSVVLKRTGYHR